MPNVRPGQPKLPQRLPPKPAGQQPVRIIPGGGKNLRALSAAPVEEEMPNLLPFESSRVGEAGYSSASKTLYVRFVDGTPWLYFNVEQNEWRNFRRSASPGKYINRILNNHSYSRGSF